MAFGQLGSLGTCFGTLGLVSGASTSSPSPGTAGNRQFSMASFPTPFFLIETNTVREFVIQTTIVEDKR